MPSLKTAPYGSWASPITSDLIASNTIRLGDAILDGSDIYWLEGRPSEGGRNVLVRRDAEGEVMDLIPPPYNARTRVHEYGGGAVIVDGDVILFSNYKDQRLYRASPDQEPVPLTEPAPLRYADGVVDRARGRIICVREDHSQAAMAENADEAVNTLVAVGLEDGRQQVLVAGNDFYASPRLSPDGSQLAWLTWNHPNMPWNSTELWVADVDTNGDLSNARLVAGGASSEASLNADGAESIFEPTWSPDGVLTFASDCTGWWNLYRWEATVHGTHQTRCILEMEAEFGQPQWAFGLSTYAYASPSTIVCTYTQHGTDWLARLDVATGRLDQIRTSYTSISGVQTDGSRVVFRGGAPTEPPSLISVNLTTQEHNILKRSADFDMDPGYLSAPEPISYPSEDRTAYGLFYPPTNRDYIAPEGEKPPLLVFTHGGPTGATSSALNLHIQFWTSRGFAVLDVNYGGSAGYGRAYRDQLLGRWGIVDVEDCTNGARYLVKQGLVDEERLAIRGGSAGGYTTLSALTFGDVFSAGASRYGVSDLEALARDTHKFESRYLDGLVGPYPEERELYMARSPLHHLDKLNTPVIFFQGLEDEVVPPSQAEVMVTALQEKGVPVAYLGFEGEQHGFRQEANIKRALDAELYFYGRIFGFTPADEIEPVLIENL